MKFLRIEQLIFEYSKEILNQIIFNVILIAQSDKMLDKQIRSLIEYDVKHIKMNNGFFFFLPTSFLAVEKWYGQRMKLGSQVIWYQTAHSRPLRLVRAV